MPTAFLVAYTKDFVLASRDLVQHSIKPSAEKHFRGDLRNLYINDVSYSLESKARALSVNPEDHFQELIGASLKKMFQGIQSAIQKERDIIVAHHFNYEGQREKVMRYLLAAGYTVYGLEVTVEGGSQDSLAEPLDPSEGFAQIAMFAQESVTERSELDLSCFRE